MNNMNRRGFFASLVKATGLLALAPTVLTSVFSSTANAQKKRSQTPATTGGKTAMPMVDPNDGAAKAVKYVEDFKKSPESKGNKCATCGFYGKKETRDGKEVGTCTIFPEKLVYANAWCLSWNKKQV